MNEHRGYSSLCSFGIACDNELNYWEEIEIDPTGNIAECFRTFSNAVREDR